MKYVAFNCQACHKISVYILSLRAIKQNKIIYEATVSHTYTTMSSFFLSHGKTALRNLIQIILLT